MRFEIAEGVGSHSLTEIRQKTYWTSQTVTAHKDGWPSLLVTTSVQGGPVDQWNTARPVSATTRWKVGGRKGKEGFLVLSLYQILAGNFGTRGVSGVGCGVTR